MYDALFKRWGPQGWWPAKSPFEVTIGAILAQNTAWKNVERVIKRLEEEDLLCPDTLSALEKETLAAIIKPAGFMNLKAERIMNFLNFLKKEYDADMEKMKKEPLDSLRKKLLSIKGIGEETADAIALYACDKLTFVVDAYTYRILARHNIVKSMNYKAIKELFERSLPKDLSIYKEYHALLVKCAKEYCRKIPLCKECPLRNI